MKLAKNNSTVAFCCKFLMLMINIGLKAHQTPCVWASGSLDDRFHNLLLVSAQESSKTRKEKQICNLRNNNSKIEKEIVNHINMN
jgi:hypothetical protein